MHVARSSLAGLMGAVLVAALCLAAMRSASEMWAGATFLATCAILGVAAIGAVCRGGDERAWWLRFAVFGWGYLGIAYFAAHDAPPLPTTIALEAVCTKAGLEIPLVPLVKSRGRATIVAPAFTQIGHCLWAIVAAIAGGMLGAVFFGRPNLPADRALAGNGAPDHEPPNWWRSPVVLGAAGFGLVLLVAVVGGAAGRRCGRARSFS